MNTKNVSRIALGGMLIAAGISHLTFARKEFQAQVPEWVPLKKDDTVAYSGVAEIVLGATVALAPKKQQSIIGFMAAGFFAAVFPGNIAQYLNRKDGFGLDTDNRRFARLFMQPLLMAWAITSMEKEKTI